jgi:hypothetical protein
MGGYKLLQHQSAEELREHQDWEKEVGLGGNPLLAIAGKTATGYDHVYVRMVGHGRTPGVQHRGDADAGAKVFFIGGNRQHGLGGGLE